MPWQQRMVLQLSPPKHLQHFLVHLIYEIIVQNSLYSFLFFFQIRISMCDILIFLIMKKIAMRNKL